MGRRVEPNPSLSALEVLGGFMQGKKPRAVLYLHCDGQVSDPLAKASSKCCLPSELSRLIKKRIVLFSVPVSHTLISQGETSRPGVRASVKHCIQKN